MSYLLDFWIPSGSDIKLFDLLIFFMLIFTRWLCLSVMLPWLGALLLPSPARIGLALAMSMVSMSFLLPKTHLAVDINIYFIVLLLIKEALIGLLLGFLGSLIFYCYELFGEIIDLARAASMAKLLVPHLRHQSSPMGTLLFQFSVVIFIALGLHRHIIATIFMSFERFPLFEAPRLSEAHFFELATSIMAMLFKTAFNLSLPVIFICFLIDLAFGFLNRVSPQINAYFLSLPAKIMGGLIVLWLAISFLIDDFVEMSSELGNFLLNL